MEREKNLKKSKDGLDTCGFVISRSPVRSRRVAPFQIYKSKQVNQIFKGVGASTLGPKCVPIVCQTRATPSELTWTRTHSGELKPRGTAERRRPSHLIDYNAFEPDP